MNQIPEQLDWVKIRAECTVLQVFKKLRDEIIGDIAVRGQYLTKPQKGVGFELQDRDAETFVVYRNSPSGISASVSFAIIGSSIEVIDGKGTHSLEATVGLNDAGHCILRVKDGSELERWQFRKRALEALFFWS